MPQLVSFIITFVQLLVVYCGVYSVVVAAA